MENKPLPSKKALAFILITAFLNMMGIGIIIPVIPFLVQMNATTHNLSTVAFDVGLLISIYSFCQFIAAPGLGMLSDRFGRRPILLISLFGSAIGYFLLGIGGSLWILYLGRVIDGLTGGNISTIFSYIADSSVPKDRAKYYGLIGAAMGFGFVIGPALGGLIAHISLSAPFYIAAAITVINIVWGYFSLPESLKPEHRLAKFELSHLNPFGQMGIVLSSTVLKKLFFIGFFYFLPFAALQGNGSVFMKDVMHWDARNIGIVFFIIGIVDIVTQGFLIRKFIKRFGETKVIGIGYIFVILGFIGFSTLVLVPLPFLPYMSAVMFAFGGGLAEPSLSAIISHTAKPHEQGRVQGANQSMQSITRVIGPLAAAWLYGIGWNIPYIFCVFLAGIALIAVLRFSANQKPSYVQEEK